MRGADHNGGLLVRASPHDEARTVTLDGQGFGTIGFTLAQVGVPNVVEPVGGIHRGRCSPLTMPHPMTAPVSNCMP